MIQTGEEVRKMLTKEEYSILAEFFESYTATLSADMQATVAKINAIVTKNNAEDALFELMKGDSNDSSN